MRRTRSTCVIFLTALALAASFSAAPPAATAAPSAAEYGVILNLSGRQRMLTQRMCKEMMLIGLDVDRAENLMALEETASLFATTLTGLRKGSSRLGLPATTSKPVLAQLDKIDARWKRFDAIVQAVLESGQVDKPQAALIARENLPLLEECDTAVKMWEKEAQASGMKAHPTMATVINVSGRQRMLSQKMTKEYFLIAYGCEAEVNRKHLVETMKQFQKALTGLESGDKDLGLPATTDSATKIELLKVKKTWRLFRPYLDNAAKEGFEITEDDLFDATEMSDTLLAQMNKVVKLYEAAASKGAKGQ